MARARIAAFAALFAMAALVPSISAAQDQGGYLGLSIGQSTYDGFCSNLNPGVTCDDKDTAFRIFGGYQFHRNFAVEAGYHKLGSAGAAVPGGAALSFEATTLEVLAVGILPLGEKFALYGKAGLYINGDAELSAGGASVSESKNDLTFGVGAEYKITPRISVRAEWQRYQDLSSFDLLGINLFSGDVDVMSLGVVFRFP